MSGAHPPPRKRLGQHFLSDPRILDRIVDALGLGGGETVIEIGAGRGALTDRLVPACRRLIAVELDRTLAPLLRERYAHTPSVHIVEGDILDMDLGALADGPYVLVGNVPYYITTPILFHALRPPRADRAVYLVQREVADRLAAQPDTSEYGALTVNVRVFADVECVFSVPARAFTPAPKVESMVVRVTPRATALVSADEARDFSTFVQRVFSQRRKQMKAIVRAIAGVPTQAATTLVASVGLDPAARPETVAPSEFVALFRALRA